MELFLAFWTNKILPPLHREDDLNIDLRISVGHKVSCRSYGAYSLVGRRFYKHGAPLELQIPTEGPVLEKGEDGVQLRQRRALRRLRLLCRMCLAGELTVVSVL
jgi:hypothetical protein